MRRVHIAKSLFNSTSRVTSQGNRFYASLAVKEAKVAQFNQFGSIEQVVKVETVPLPSTLKDDEVLVKFLAAPINPADFNIVQGNYGTTPNLPAVGGSEGVAVVEQVGSNVTELKVNQRVIPARPGFGTWRTHAVVKASELQSVSADIPVEYAATIAVNPCTAYRLLADFVELKAGDVIVQNAANSAVGISVIQMAKARGIKTINIVRDRPSQDSVIDRLKQLGGDIVVTESYANSLNMSQLVSDLPKAKLALNSVGGQSARTVARFLGESGTMVTFGGMSRKPIIIPTSPFIFNDITLKGFWLSRWVEQHSKQERQQMLDAIAEMIKSKQLVLFQETFKFADFEHAVKASTQPYRARKVVLKMD